MNPIILFHDGNTDSHLLAHFIENKFPKRLKGVIITSADSFGEVTIDIASRVSLYLQQRHIPIGLSQARGHNCFPWEWRKECVKVREIEALKSYSSSSFCEDGDLLFEKLLQVESDQSVTVITVCPLTAMKITLEKVNEASKKIKELIWMGGSIQGGNVLQEVIGLERPNSEWNVFWDPYAVDWIFKNTAFSITLIPIEPCDSVNLSSHLLQNLEEQSKHDRLSLLAWQIYSLVKDETYYRLWNTTAVLYVLNPDLFDEPSQMQLKVITKFGKEQGSLKQSLKGKNVKVVLKIKNLLNFQDYFLNLLKSESLPK